MADRTDRAVSTVVSYVLVLGIIAILASALIGAFGPFVTNQQQAAAGSTLKVLGNDLAADVESVDQLAERSGDDGTVVMRTRLPEAVGGSPYEIEIRSATGNRSEIVLKTVDFDARAVVVVRTTVDLQTLTGPNALEGGDLRVVYEPTNDRLVVRDA